MITCSLDFWSCEINIFQRLPIIEPKKSLLFATQLVSVDSTGRFLPAFPARHESARTPLRRRKWIERIKWVKWVSNPASHPVEMKIGNQWKPGVWIPNESMSINHVGALKTTFCLPIRNVLERKRKAACPPEFKCLWDVLNVKSREPVVQIAWSNARNLKGYASLP